MAYIKSDVWILLVIWSALTQEFNQPKSAKWGYFNFPNNGMEGRKGGQGQGKSVVFSQQTESAAWWAHRHSLNGIQNH